MAKLIRARCQSCGKEVEVQWTLGSKCPACGSNKFYPVVRVGESSGEPARKKVSTSSRKPVGLFLALIFCAVGVTALILRVRSTSGQKEYRRKLIMTCTNEDCPNPNPDKLFVITLPTTNVFPEVTCPFCKRKTGYRAVRCRRCGTVFALEPRGTANPTLDLLCPNCESTDIDLDSYSPVLRDLLKEGEQEE